MSTRLVALIFDVPVVWFGVSLVEAILQPRDQFWAFWRMLALVVGYEALFVQEKGQTIGKAIAGIEVVALDGARATPHQVWLRALVKVVQFSCCGLSFLLAPFVTDRRGFHDIAAGTKVVVKTPESHRKSEE